jgi:hypothetical protein
MSARQTQLFYPSRCPVCRETALETYANAREVEVECGGCGGFAITVSTKFMLTGYSRRQRKNWLAQARQQTSAGATGNSYITEVEQRDTGFLD